MKMAKVIPLFKSADSSLFNNYRPISILSVFSKLYERLFYNRLIDFLNQENILYKNQFGFRKAHSTQLALILLLDKITSALEDGKYVIGEFLNFSKVFDTVNHTILLQKLAHYGIRGLANDWICSYLNNRSQFVSYDGINSDKQIIKCGVPQGSILGPLLFLVYINDLASVSNQLFMYMFADDTNVFAVDNNIQTLETTLNHELSLLCNWLKANKLSLNVNKTHYMIFSPTRKKIHVSINLTIDNNAIEKVKQTKFLGVILDDELTWKPHINYVKGKLYKSIGIIHKAKQYLTMDALKSIYYAFIYPYLIYCILVWGGTNITTLDPIIKAQKRAIRCLASKPKYSKSEPLFKSLNILNYHQIYKQHVLLFVYKFKLSLLPSVFKRFFVLNSEIHNHNTRQIYDFHPPKVRTELRKTGIKYAGCVYWNSLDNKIKSKIMTMSVFKKYITDNCL